MLIKRRIYVLKMKLMLYFDLFPFLDSPRRISATLPSLKSYALYQVSA